MAGLRVQHLTRTPGLALILVLAVAVRLAFAIVMYPWVAGRFSLDLHDPYDKIAANLVNGRGYVECAGDPPTLRRLPAYPLLLAGIFRVTGLSLRAVQIIQALLATATCLTVFLLAACLYEYAGIGLAAAAFTGLHPALIQYAARYYTETLYTLLLALFVYSCTRALRAERAAPSTWRWVLSGICFGVATLTRGTAVLLPLVLALPIARRLDARRRMLVFAAFVGAAATVIVPWSTYASRLAGTPVLLSTWAAAPFYHGLYASRRMLTGHSLGDLDAEANQKLTGIVGSGDGLSPAAQVSRERATMRVIQAEVRAAPGANVIAWLRGLGMVWIWGRSPWSMMLYLLLHVPVLVLAAIELRQAHAPGELSVLVLTAGYFGVFHAIYYPQARYILPVVPLLAIPAAATLLRPRAEDRVCEAINADMISHGR